MKSVIWALLSALLLILSFPKFNLCFLAWVGLVPLFLAIRDKSQTSSFTLSFLAGIVFFMGVFFNFLLLYKNAWIDFLILAVYVNAYLGLFGIFYNFILKRSRISPIIVAPFLWVSLEYLRSHADFLSYPYALIGYSQSANLPLIQISSLTGVYGVSFLIVMVNAALSEVILNRSKAMKPAIAVLFILLLSYLYGYSLLSKHIESKRISVTVIQGNVLIEKLNQELQQVIMDKQARLTREATKGIETSLVAWPEGAVLGLLFNDPRLINVISALARENNSYFIVGSSRHQKLVQDKTRKGRLMNSAFLISPDGKIEGQYNKIRLFPFGEYLPYRDSLSWPKRYLKIEDTYMPGAAYTMFDINNMKFGVTICWENIFPDFFRKFVEKGAHFMVNITNEGRLGETVPYQFLSMNVFRAVENRVSIVRAANTGVSCFIDPFGRIIGKIQNNQKEIFIEGYLTEKMPLSYEKTFYTSYGDIFTFLCIGGSIAMLIVSFLKKQ